MSQGPELIVTEKDNAARRIADILSGGSAEADRLNGVNVYKWGGKRCIGLSGHVVGVDFPPEYNDWRDVEPVELIDAPIDKHATQENIVAALRRLARKAGRVAIATDYDREGELIGKEAYELVREVNEDVPVDRVRFSSITEREVTEAFENPDELDFDLAAAGEARQIVDLVWGAALTRFLSLSARQLGDDFISVGRVQGPTLKLIVDREREIEAFDPEDYWELFADLAKDAGATGSDGADAGAFQAQYFYLDEDGNEAERVWDEEAAETAYETLEAATAATVDSVHRRTRTDDPPAPFNTTQFIRAAGSLGYSAQRAMSIAEDLYTAGYLTYPRTDNTVYPDDLDPRDLLDAFVGTRAFDDDASALLEQESIEPTEGDEETTDHPPIHPTGELPSRTELSEDEWEVYELVVRRFFATVAESATWEHLRVVATVGDDEDLSLKANGKRLVEPGYHAVYPYSNASESFVPDVTEGETLTVTDTSIEAKQTQPPRRYGQSRLIETMEEMEIGTKCLTEDTNVLVRTESGEIKRTSVDTLFEEEQIVIADGDTDIGTTTGGPRTVSFSESAGRTIEPESELVSKRPLGPNERVLEIETEFGGFSVTEEHPLYINRGGTRRVVPAAEIEPSDELLATRASPSDSTADRGDAPVVLSWEEFAATADESTKLFGVECGDVVARIRSDTEETQTELATRLGTTQARVSAMETGKRGVPVWVLGKLGTRPTELRGLNQEVCFRNPFPLRWSSVLARVLGNLLGDGSVHVNERENVVDVRYHNTNTSLIDRFTSDIETLFGVAPSVSAHPGHEEYHRTKYQVNVPASIGRVLHHLLKSVQTDGCPDLPTEFAPAFIGALFDDEGHISRERKAFISNVDHDLLAGVGRMLDEFGIESKLSPAQHKLHIRGRRNVERFFDVVPVASDEKFHRALDGLREYDVTHHKAHILESTAERPQTSDELAAEINLTRGRTNAIIRELREDGYLNREIDGSNRSIDDNRTIRYVASGFDRSIYAAVLGCPSLATVRSVTERDYDGPVYDLSVTDEAPNFAVDGGVIVHNSTRHDVIQKLYDRGYIESDPPRPTRLARAVVEASEEFADRIVSEEMTAQLEQDMQAIARGEASLSEVTEESREILEKVFEGLMESGDEVGEHLRKSLKADKTVGECPECGSDLVIRKSRGGSYFIGCDAYPDCTYTLPLPSTGKPLILEEECEEHGLSHIKMLAGRKTFVHGCPLCKAEEADAQEDLVIGPCPDCGSEEGATSETSRGEGGEAAEAGGELAIKRLRSGSRLVGCTRYPDCEYSLPMPRRGEVEVTEEICEEHDLPELRITYEDDREPWELGCPICNYREYQAEESESGSELESVDGIGEKTAAKLKDAGVDDVASLKEAEPDTLADRVDGVGPDTVRKWQADAD
ncbi:DNA topoisomerase I [Halobellus ordinarius]|uniref:DNA topoisomerase I n=1 Tax=Halobellus ordinarius TaxID=3075120 RepID=UPI00288047D7|nr:DNA topoisomerase I [Halobellus sp. ZY16]